MGRGGPPRGPSGEEAGGQQAVNDSEKIVLKVLKPDGAPLLKFPMIPPLRGLVAAVEAQLSREEDEFLSTLAAA